MPNWNAAKTTVVVYSLPLVSRLSKLVESRSRGAVAVAVDPESPPSGVKSGTLSGDLPTRAMTAVSTLKVLDCPYEPSYHYWKDLDPA